MSKFSIPRGQLSLLGVPERKRQRLALDSASWVEHVPRWLSDDEEMFETLSNVADWEQRTRWMFERYVLEPRLTAEYPVLAEAPVPLREVGARLSAELGVPYDSALAELVPGPSREHELARRSGPERRVRRAGSEPRRNAALLDPPEGRWTQHHVRRRER